MQALVRGVLKKEMAAGGVVVYLDEILIHTATAEENDRILESVCLIYIPVPYVSSLCSQQISQ